MRPVVILFLFALLFSSCSGKDSSVSKKDSLQTEFVGKGQPVTDSGQISSVKLLDFESIKDKFKYAHLNSFEIDTFQWDERENHYNIIDTSTNYSIWQDNESISYTPDIGYTGRNYYYSIQKPIGDLNSLTVLQEDESCCSVLYYLLYDRNGKLINKFQVAGKGGDAGWSYNSWGKFVNDSTYELVTIESEIAGIDSLTQKEITESDSIIFEYRISSTGQINEKKLEEYKGIKSYY